MNPENWLSGHTLSQWPVMLLDASLKCTALLAAACLVAWLLRRRNPAARAWVFHLTLLAVPVVFAAAFFLPDSPWMTRLPVQHLTESRNAAHEMRVVDVEPVSVTMANPPQAASAASALSPSQWAFWGWLVSAAVCFAWMTARGAWRGLSRRSLAEVHRGPLVDLLETERSACGLRVRPRLFLAPARAMPATWGVFRPAILLPREASGWSPERLRHVFWHEMAHIRRKDVLLAALAVPAHALLWFHPLLWIAWKAMTRSREAACDDIVLAMGQADPADYSHDLLEIARAHGAVTQLATTGMADRGNLAARIHRLLDNSAPATLLSRAGRNGITLAWTAITAAVIVLVSCRTLPPALPSSGGSMKTTLCGKPKPGAGTLNFALIEISFTEGKGSPIEAALKENSSGAIAIESLRWLSQQRGVDLISSGEVKEGQSIERSSGSFSMKFSGIQAVDESRILTDAAITLPAEAGGKPDKPLELSGLRIPDGGFVLLPGTKRGIADETDQPTPAKFKNNVFIPRQHVRILALAATSSAAPGLPASSMKVLPGDASLPRGDDFIAYVVKFIERPADKPLPDPPKNLWHTSSQNLATSITGMLADRETTLVTYPRIISKPGVPVKIRNLVFRENRSNPGTLIPEGSELTLSGAKAAKAGLRIEVDWKHHSTDREGKPSRSGFHTSMDILPGQVPGLVGSMPVGDGGKVGYLFIEASRFINE